MTDAAILFYAVSHLHEGTGKLRKTRADTFRHLTESVSSLVSEKMTSRSPLRCAGRGPVVPHPSTDPAPSCLIWEIGGNRIPTAYRTLSAPNKYFLCQNFSVHTNMNYLKSYIVFLCMRTKINLYRTSVQVYVENLHFIFQRMSRKIHS